MVVSDAGPATFTRGASIANGPLVVSATDAFGLNDSSALGAGYHTNDNWSYVKTLSGQASTNQNILANQQIMNNSLGYADALNGALGGCVPPWKKSLFAGGKLTTQLKTIASIIAASGQTGVSGLGLTRQIFFCSLGGFDNHANQWEDQSALLGELDFALDAFYTAMGSIGAGSQVTTFTMSDFGRTFQPGSYSGTDHAWGSHQLVLGDAVHGQQIFGTYPDLTLGGVDDKDGYPGGPSGEGRWIPTTSVEQYAATLAKWYEPTLSLPGLLPNLANFAPQTLGFL
jgi:uncharacterized protein (DUF1501 family)